MALVISNQEVNTSGSYLECIGTMAFDASYPTGGEPVTAEVLANRPVIELIDIEIDPEGGYVFEFDSDNETVLVYESGAVAAHAHTIAVTDGTAGNAVTNNAGVLEATDGDDLTTETAGAVSAGGLAEVANATDLSALTAVTYRIRVRC
jgi:VCBS repeat-containing protein